MVKTYTPAQKRAYAKKMASKKKTTKKVARKTTYKKKPVSYKKPATKKNDYGSIKQQKANLASMYSKAYSACLLNAYHSRPVKSPYGSTHEPPSSSVFKASMDTSIALDVAKPYKLFYYTDVDGKPGMKLVLLETDTPVVNPFDTATVAAQSPTTTEWEYNDFFIHGKAPPADISAIEFYQRFVSAFLGFEVLTMDQDNGYCTYNGITSTPSNLQSANATLSSLIPDSNQRLSVSALDTMDLTKFERPVVCKKGQLYASGLTPNISNQTWTLYESSTNENEKINQSNRLCKLRINTNCASILFRAGYVQEYYSSIISGPGSNVVEEHTPTFSKTVGKKILAPSNDELDADSHVITAVSKPSHSNRQAKKGDNVKATHQSTLDSYGYKSKDPTLAEHATGFAHWMEETAHGVSSAYTATVGAIQTVEEIFTPLIAMVA